MANNESTLETEVMSWPIPTIRLLGSGEWVGAVIRSFHPMMEMFQRKNRFALRTSESIKAVLRPDPIHRLLTKLHMRLCGSGCFFPFPVQPLFWPVS